MNIVQGVGSVVLGGAGLCLTCFALREAHEIVSLNKFEAVIGRALRVLGFAILGCSLGYVSYWLGKSLILATNVPSFLIPFRFSIYGLAIAGAGDRIENG